MTLSDLETLQREKPTLHWAALRLHDQTTRFDIVTRVCTGMLLWVSHAPVVRNGGPAASPNTLGFPFHHTEWEPVTKFCMVMKLETFYKVDHAYILAKNLCDTNADANQFAVPV